MNLNQVIKEFLHHAATVLAVVSLPYLIMGDNQTGPALAMLAVLARLASKSD